MPDYAFMNQCLYEGKAKEVEQMTKDALAEGRPVSEVLTDGLIAGMSVVGGATGATLGLLSNREQDEAAARCPPTSCSPMQSDAANAKIRTSYREAFAADVAFGVAALAAVGAGVLWFTSAPDRDDAALVRVLPSVAPAQASVVVMGKF